LLHPWKGKNATSSSDGREERVKKIKEPQQTIVNLPEASSKKAFIPFMGRSSHDLITFQIPTF
jgi:hypothetical protein